MVSKTIDGSSNLSSPAKKSQVTGKPDFFFYLNPNFCTFAPQIKIEMTNPTPMVDLKKQNLRIKPEIYAAIQIELD